MVSGCKTRSMSRIKLHLLPKKTTGATANATPRNDKRLIIEASNHISNDFKAALTSIHTKFQATLNDRHATAIKPAKVAATNSS